MVRVSKCCCCFNLKYGFLTFSVLSLLYRVCMVFSSFYLSKADFSVNDHSSFYPSMSRVNNAHISIGPAAGGAAGWYIGTAILLALSIKGIFEKRSIFLYPYIVVLIVEIIVFVIAMIIMAIIVSPWVFISLFIVGAVNTYAIICLISLYKDFKEYERSHRPTVVSYEGVALKTV